MRILFSCIFLLLVFGIIAWVLIDPHTMLFRHIGLLEKVFVAIMSIVGFFGFTSIGIGKE